MTNEINRVPKISVALFTYNGEKYLRAQLDSILRQTIHPFEIIIVDDCSTDSTVRILEEYAARTSFIKYYENEHNLGFVRNFSLAISKTCGDYVALSDQDDIWTEDHLEKLVKNINGKAVCVGDSIMVDSDGRELGMKFSEVKQNYYIPEDDVLKAYRIIYNYSPYQGASMLIDRSWVNSLLPIPAEAGFHDTFLSCCASLTKGLTVIPDIITRYRMHNSNVSSSWKVTIFNEIRHRRHYICFESKPIIIDYLLKHTSSLSPKAKRFVDEFKHILDLDKRKRTRFKILMIKNRHYKEIYSQKSYKYILIRSLHFLLSL